jgi:hypothetical protein
VLCDVTNVVAEFMVSFGWSLIFNLSTGMMLQWAF